MNAFRNTIIALVIALSVAVVVQAADLPGFADPVSMTLSSNSVVSGQTLTVTAQDSIVYQYGYYKLGNQAWTRFDLTGTGESRSGWNYDASTAVLNMQGAPAGNNNYVAIYACTWSNYRFTCQNNQWQINKFTVVAGNNACAADECEFDSACYELLTLHPTIDGKICAGGVWINLPTVCAPGSECLYEDTCYASGISHPVEPRYCDSGTWKENP